MVVMIVTTSNTYAQTSTVTIEGLCYSIDTKKNTATLISNGYGKYSGDIVVPSQITLGNCINFPVVAFGEECFEMCKNLTSISIPSTIKEFGENCFNGCSCLKELIIPSSVKSLGYAGLSGCSSLETITIPPTIDGFGYECFAGCYSLTEIKIPSSITYIGRNCFFGCRKLTSIIIPASVNSFADGSFYDCLKLNDIYFKGDVPKNIIYSDISKTCNLHVPEKFLQNFLDQIGSRCPNISVWNPSDSPDDPNDVLKEACSAPSIKYSDGKLHFSSDTPNAEYHYTITNSDMVSEGYSQDGSINLSATYNVSAYATAEGYLPSEISTATLCWINEKSDDAPTNINQIKSRGIIISSDDGILTVSGLNKGEKVSLFSIEGKLIGTVNVENSTASCKVSEKLIIVKIGNQSIKYIIK